MANTKHGGQAFPQPFTGHCGSEDHPDPCGCYLDFGMTLRDYFAAAALPIVRAATPAEVAKKAYDVADAMIMERIGRP
jgi:hypothetical protein